MRSPRSLPLFLTLVALCAPLRAQVQSGAAADAAAGTSATAGASFNSGGVTPLGSLNAPASLSLSPSLSPTLAAPAASLTQGLAPSALIAQPVPAASAEQAGKPKAPVAAAVAPFTPPKSPPTTAAAAAPPGGPPHFIQVLASLGVPSELTNRLTAFLSTRHPGDQDKVYHGIGHSHEVADLASRIVSRQDLTPEKKILLIFSAALHDVDPERSANTPARVDATLAHLDNDDEARGLLMDFGTRYGFTASQVKALIMATDFSMDPAQMKDKMAAADAAAKAAFPAEPDWALKWGKNLAFADQSATYVGSVDDAIGRVRGLALEIRGKNAGPSDEVILAGTYKFLSVLKQNPRFALLPEEQAKNFDGVRAHFEKRQTPEAWTSSAAPVPSRAPPASPDLAAARRYINEIMGGVRAPTEREADSLLGDWLDENGIPRNSPRAAAVRSEIVPTRAQGDATAASKLRPALRRHAAALIKLAAEHKTTVSNVETVLVKRGLLAFVDIPSEQFEHQVDMALDKDALDRVVVRYPRNEQGDLMRAVADTMGVKGGKSVEEVARDGVFLYADFASNKFRRGFVSRDPDIQGHTIAFYITHKDGQWHIDGYRQQKFSRTADSSYIEQFKTWLNDGGLPSSDFR